MAVNRQDRMLVLCQYPVVKNIRQQITKDLDGVIEFFVVSTEASAGYRGLLKVLRSRPFDKVFVLVADESVEPLVRVLQVLSLAVPAPQRYIIDRKGQTRSFTVFDGVLALGRICLVSALGFFAMLYSGLSAYRLLSRPRVMPIVDGNTMERSIGYLRTNLWLGVQAGGALTHTWGVIQASIKQGWKVFYLSFDNRRSAAGREVEHVPMLPKFPYIIPREFNHFLYDLSFAAAAFDVLKNFKGLLYQRTSLGNFSGVKISRKLCLPLVIEYNGSENWLSRNWGTPFLFNSIIDIVELASLRHAHVITTVSEPLRAELLARGVPDERIVVHPNGVNAEKFDSSRFDTDEINELRRAHGIPEDGIVITFVGTFGPWHGAEILSDAALYFYEHRAGEFPNVPDLYFLFIGDGVKRIEVASRVAHLLTSGKVILTGLVDSDEIPLYLAASDILATPTLKNPDGTAFFGSPTKLFEYMASSRPVIASDIGQIADIFADSPMLSELDNAETTGRIAGDGEFGVRVQPGDKRQILDAIIFAANDPEWRKSAGARARERVLEKYTWENQVSAVYEQLFKVLESDRRKDRTRILVNALHSKSGGGLTYLRNVLPRMIANEQLDVHVCLQKRQETLFEPSLSGATLHYIDEDKNLFQVLIAEQLHLPQLARRINAAVIFSPANYGPIFFRSSVILIRNALSVAFVERRIRKLVYWFLLYLATSISAIRSRKVIFVSDYARQSTLGSAFYRENGGATIVPHGVNFDLYKPGPMEERESDTLLLVSDIYVQKNIHNLLCAMATVVKHRPNVMLKVAGDFLDSDYASRIRGIIKNLDIGDNVSFLGSVSSEDLPELYRKCTMFVFPSTVETFGNPLVEAMACGCPIACSNTAAMPEIADDAAVYFNPNDTVEMADVIIGVLNDEVLRKELSARASLRAKRYSWENTAEQTIKVLTEAANS